MKRSQEPQAVIAAEASPSGEGLAMTVLATQVQINLFCADVDARSPSTELVLALS